MLPKRLFCRRDDRAEADSTRRIVAGLCRKATGVIVSEMRPPLPAADVNCLFLDLDGTLTDATSFEERDSRLEGLNDLLIELRRRFGGAVAVVSGRTILELDRILAPVHVAAIGLHGFERRYDHIAEIDRLVTDPSIDTLRGRIVASGILHEGIWLEDKGATVAVHFHNAQEREGAVLAVLENAVIDLADIHLVRGRMTIEGKSGAINKGTAVGGFLETPLFAGRVPVYVGDDRSDEDGIRYVQSRGGFGVKVGGGDSDALYRLADVDAVHAWLAAAINH